MDEGVKRGQQQPPAPWPIRKPPIAGKLGPNFDVMPVLDRYLRGEELADIATDLGVHPKALNYHLLKPEVRELWRSAQIAVSLADLNEAKQVMRDAPDALSLGRGREISRSAQWELERLENRLFGPKQEVTVTEQIDIRFSLGKEAGALLDQLRVVSEQTVVTNVVTDKSLPDNS
ncbi:MAG: hypothetical protein Q7N50_13410 [Armatimonadota bacterium]|nr:hypothetical protein [Armatimonadota bacterium]